MGAFSLRDLVESRQGEDLDLWARGINPQFARVLRTIGFDRQWARAEGQYLYDAEGDRFLDLLDNPPEANAALKRAAKKHVSLELGNSTPLIVCSDADLDAAAEASAISGNGFAGQSCISVQRVLVDERVHEQYAQRLVAAIGRLKVGNPEEDDTDVGPLIDENARARVQEWVDEATSAGAERLTGGTIDVGHLRPTVLDRVSTDVRAWKSEIFGPVLSLRPFKSLDEAIELANGTRYGLQAGIFTTSLGSALRAAQGLEFGGVTVNEAPTFRSDQMPYGGVKDSGNTREGPHYAVREMTEERLVVVELP